MTLKENYKGKIISFSAYKIEDAEKFDFLPEDYSKFKYGAINIAQKFGHILADRFISECLSKTYTGNPIVVLPSAYSHIPTASYFMKCFFVDKLNAYLHENNHPVIRETKIHRTVTYREDYGEMSAEDRFKLIKGDKFYIDQEFIGDSTLLMLDDIKITGTHEQVLINMLNDYNLTNDCYMLYFAELVNKAIPPRVENYLNNFFIKGLDSIDAIIENEEFTFNTRVVKYILNADATSFDTFIAKRNQKFISELYYNAIGNEYFKFASYERNLNQLKTITQ